MILCFWFSFRLVQVGNLGLQLPWYFLQIIVSAWYFISVVGNLFESYFISLKKYKSLHSGKVRYLAIVIESEEAYQISKVVKLSQWLDSIGVKNVCLYDMNGMKRFEESVMLKFLLLGPYNSIFFELFILGVLKKSKETMFQKLKNAKSIEEVSEVVTLHAPDHMTLEFLSYLDGKEAVAKAANLIFVENSKRHNLGGELDLQILLEPQMNKALQIVGSKGPEPDLLLVYGPVRSHLGFPAWRLRYTEIIHMGSLNFMRYGSLMKVINNFTKVHQNYGT
ncbi:dehydrodolichyl diphosphate synthase complex subunit NUS1 isoform X1 [Glycine max]|nr:dehydrodolichyl diphosphate synthase complex subunit NUS1 isoform X1 [Glycine max]|eukprot:XP_006590433.1 dehydrodolichyl diphosphate synthase complex subunit NUS1 isoform X1 [Glycine max]